MNQEALLRVEKLNAFFKKEDGKIQALKDVSFQVNKGELLAIVGESGCGKSLTSLSIMGLTAKSCQVEAEYIDFQGEEGAGDDISGTVDQPQSPVHHWLSTDGDHLPS